MNFPLPQEEGHGRGHQPPCIVKLYDDMSDSLKLNECVEVIGVLCVDSEMASFNAAPSAEGWAFGGDARQPSTSLVPRVHAICMRRLPHYHPLLPYSPDWLTQARLQAAYQNRLGSPQALEVARAAAIGELARQLGGDLVAAEFLLLQMVSRSFNRLGDKALGSWSLNLVGWPEGAGVGNLADACRGLVPRCAHLEMTAANLNEKRWHPRKDFDANRLVAGQLQLAPGTLVLLDETKMGEGQLSAEGVRNLAALNTLVTEQSLACDFQSYNVKLPLELHCVAVSKHRSLIKDMDIVLPVQPNAQAVMPSAAAPEVLDAARFLIGVVTRQPRPLAIPSEASDQVSNDFVQVRQQFRVQPELCHTWMGLARANCLLHGESELTVSRWQGVLQLERERLMRCGQRGLLTPVGA
jgi:hypothetical protein